MYNVFHLWKALVAMKIRLRQKFLALRDYKASTLQQKAFQQMHSMFLKRFFQKTKYLDNENKTLEVSLATQREARQSAEQEIIEVIEPAISSANAQLERMQVIFATLNDSFQLPVLVLDQPRQTSVAEAASISYLGQAGDLSMLRDNLNQSTDRPPRPLTVSKPVESSTGGVAYSQANDQYESNLKLIGHYENQVISLREKIRTYQEEIHCIKTLFDNHRQELDRSQHSKFDGPSSSGMGRASQDNLSLSYFPSQYNDEISRLKEHYSLKVLEREKSNHLLVNKKKIIDAQTSLLSKEISSTLQKEYNKISEQIQNQILARNELKELLNNSNHLLQMTSEKIANEVMSTHPTLRVSPLFGCC
jgi:hypothetical protein